MRVGGGLHVARVTQENLGGEGGTALATDARKTRVRVRV